MEKNVYLNGDCFDYLPQVKDSSVTLIIGDLPYGVSDNAWDVIPDLTKLWAEYKRILKPNGIVLMFSVPPFDKILYNSNPKAYVYQLIWEKNMISNPFLRSTKPLSKHEIIDIYRFSNTKGIYNPQMSISENAEVKIRIKLSPRKKDGCFQSNKEQTPYVDDGSRYPTSILKFAHDKERCDSSATQKQRNSTQKPLKLYEYLIRTFSNEGDLVLDSFAGTATTAVAAIRTGREFICMQMDNEDNVQHPYGLDRIEKAYKDIAEGSIFDSEELKAQKKLINTKLIRERLISLSISQLKIM